MKLPSHDPIRQTTPDAMRTISDVTEHIFKLIVGREDSVKVRKAKIELGNRFSIRSTLIEKKQCVPFRLSVDELKIADDHALGILAPPHIDFLEPCSL